MYWDGVLSTAALSIRGKDGFGVGERRGRLLQVEELHLQRLEASEIQENAARTMGKIFKYQAPGMAEEVA